VTSPGIKTSLDFTLYLNKEKFGHWMSYIAIEMDDLREIERERETFPPVSEGQTGNQLLRQLYLFKQRKHVQTLSRQSVTHSR